MTDHTESDAHWPSTRKKDGFVNGKNHSNAGNGSKEAAVCVLAEEVGWARGQRKSCVSNSLSGLDQ